MAARLDELRNGRGTAGPASRDNVFAPEAMVEFLRQIEPPPDLRSRTLLAVRLGRALLFAGATEEAVAELRRARGWFTDNPDLFKSPFRDQLWSLSAIAALRLGEQQNCLAGRGTASCLLPISGEGIHHHPAGAREAKELYMDLLERKPEDLGYRWLLNIAAMALGEYPEGLPEPLRIPASAFDSEAGSSRFFDIAPALGLDVVGLSGGVVLEDLDGDLDLDLMVSSWGLADPLRFFRNDGNGTFNDSTRTAGLEGLGGGLNLIHGDYDNDGLADIFVLRGAWQGAAGHQPNSLLRNLGDGRFDDVTSVAGVLDYHPTQTAAWGDFDNDGWLDLFVGNETSGREIHPCRLFRNQHDGTFREVAAETGSAVKGYVKGVAWGDIDNDGDLDLYISRLDGANALLRNDPSPEGGRRFEDIAATVGVEEPFHSFPTWFWDFDNDGWLDLFVATYPVDFLTADATAVAADLLGLGSTNGSPRLYRNRGDGTFEDLTRKRGLDHVLLAMGSNFGDLDNDGWLDLYLGTGAPDFRALMPNRMFQNHQGTFLDVTTAGGFGHLQKGHGIAFGDIDHDGDQDIYAVMGGAFSGDLFQNLLFENPGGPNHWITLILEGTRSNRSAIGTRLELQLQTARGSRSVHATVSTGGSFGSSSLRQELGLGQATSLHRLVVRWPSGETQSFTDLGADQFFRIREGDTEPELLHLSAFALAPVSTAAEALHLH